MRASADYRDRDHYLQNEAKTMRVTSAFAMSVYLSLQQEALFHNPAALLYLSSVIIYTTGTYQ